MKHPCLLLACLLGCILAANAQQQRIDSLTQEIAQLDDSVSSPLWYELGLAYWNRFREDSLEADLDSIFAIGQRLQAWGEARNDTQYLWQAPLVRRLYGFGKRDTALVREAYEGFLKWRGWYGFKLGEGFDNIDDLDGYRFTQIYNSFRVWTDSVGNANFAQVSDSSFLPNFGPNQSSAFSIRSGLSYWVRLRLIGEALRSDRHFFMVGKEEYSWDSIEVYIPDEQGQYQKQLSGFAYLPKEKAIPNWRNIFSVMVPKGTEQVIYLRLAAHNHTKKLNGIYINHLDRISLLTNEVTNSHLNGIFQGVVWIQSIYFFLLFLATRVRSYGFYVLYILGLGLFVATANYYHHLFPHHPGFIYGVWIIAVVLSAYGLIRFGESFLDLKRNLPRWRWTGTAYLILFLPIALSTAYLFSFRPFWISQENIETWGNANQTALDTLLIYCVLGFVLLLIWGIMVYRKGYKPAAYYLLALGFLAAGFSLPGLGKVFGLNMTWLTFDRAILSMEIGVILQLSFPPVH